MLFFSVTTLQKYIEYVVLNHETTTTAVYFPTQCSAYYTVAVNQLLYTVYDPFRIIIAYTKFVTLTLVCTSFLLNCDARFLLQYLNMNTNKYYICILTFIPITRRNL